MNLSNNPQIKEIDLHDSTVLQAQQILKSFIASLDRNVTEVRVIHGYRGGKSLQKFVRNGFKHKRVEKVMLDLNPGITILKLKSW
jgi:DNA-nicking Smr family endonuclease